MTRGLQLDTALDAIDPRQAAYAARRAAVRDEFEQLQAAGAFKTTTHAPQAELDLIEPRRLVEGEAEGA
jgi:hypothetical protein